MIELLKDIIVIKPQQLIINKEEWKLFKLLLLEPSVDLTSLKNKSSEELFNLLKQLGHGKSLRRLHSDNIRQHLHLFNEEQIKSLQKLTNLDWPMFHKLLYFQLKDNDYIESIIKMLQEISDNVLHSLLFENDFGYILGSDTDILRRLKETQMSKERLNLFNSILNGVENNPSEINLEAVLLPESISNYRKTFDNLIVTKKLLKLKSYEFETIQEFFKAYSYEDPVVSEFLWDITPESLKADRRKYILDEYEKSLKDEEAQAQVESIKTLLNALKQNPELLLPINKIIRNLKENYSLKKDILSSLEEFIKLDVTVKEAFVLKEIFKEMDYLEIKEDIKKYCKQEIIGHLENIENILDASNFQANNIELRNINNSINELQVYFFEKPFMTTTDVKVKPLTSSFDKLKKNAANYLKGHLPLLNNI
jgi:hypothetical protein